MLLPVIDNPIEFVPEFVIVPVWQRVLLSPSKFIPIELFPELIIFPEFVIVLLSTLILIPLELLPDKLIVPEFVIVLLIVCVVLKSVPLIIFIPWEAVPDVVIEPWLVILLLELPSMSIPWASLPDVVILPKELLRKVFESLKYNVIPSPWFPVVESVPEFVIVLLSLSVVRRIACDLIPEVEIVPELVNVWIPDWYNQIPWFLKPDVVMVPALLIVLLLFVGDEIEIAGLVLTVIDPLLVIVTSSLVIVVVVALFITTA